MTITGSASTETPTRNHSWVHHMNTDDTATWSNPARNVLLLQTSVVPRSASAPLGRVVVQKANGPLFLDGIARVPAGDCRTG